jgi:hypothetical protein
MASCITARAGGALASMALLMPVSCSMKGGTQAPLFIRLWKRPTICPSSTSTTAISVARAPWAGDMPVVSKSMTARVVAWATIVCRFGRRSQGPLTLPACRQMM